MPTAISAPSVGQLAKWTCDGEYDKVLEHIDETFDVLNRLGDAVKPEERRCLYQAGLISSWRTGNQARYRAYKRRKRFLPRSR